ncbi:MAG: branched-chain amino acid aminotransferase [Myxococcota bacterium]
MEIGVTRTTTPKKRPPEAELGFGKHFTDHMFRADYTPEQGWHDARVQPYGSLGLDPAAGVFHYGQAMFEGLKAFRGVDGKVRLFRPEANAHRMATGAPRLCMEAPTEADMVKAFHALVRVDVDWVPRASATALYLRPTLVATEPFLGVRPATRFCFFIIASPVGAYFTGGMKAVKIWIEPTEVRAPRGGLGAVKAGANYAASLHAANEAKKKGFDQVLWLDGKDHEFIEEVGTMNFFVVLGRTLVTPPLSDSILAGVTRDSLITLARERGYTVEERALSVKELKSAHKAGIFKEAFGVGTAAVVSPVGELAFGAERLVINDGKPGSIAQDLYAELTAIQRAEKPDTHGWLQLVE